MSLINTLWKKYGEKTAHVQKIIQSIPDHTIILDHFAMIDLPSLHSGIPVLRRLFEGLDYQFGGEGYLEDKQNPYMWLTPKETHKKTVAEVLPQIVIADFCLDKMPGEINKIIQKYTQYISPCLELETYCLNPRPWPLPTVKDYEAVKNYNELLAWVLVFGHEVNHFGLRVEGSLENFSGFVQKELAIILNSRQGVIKGSPESGILQSATEGEKMRVSLADGEIEIHGPFMEFVYRYPRVENPVYWSDYFTGFVGHQANTIIESVYT